MYVVLGGSIMEMCDVTFALVCAAAAADDDDDDDDDDENDDTDDNNHHNNNSNTHPQTPAVTLKESSRRNPKLLAKAEAALPNQYAQHRLLVYPKPEPKT